MNLNHQIILVEINKKIYKYFKMTYYLIFMIIKNLIILFYHISQLQNCKNKPKNIKNGISYLRMINDKLSY